MKTLLFILLQVIIPQISPPSVQMQMDGLHPIGAEYVQPVVPMYQSNGPRRSPSNPQTGEGYTSGDKDSTWTESNGWVWKWTTDGGKWRYGNTGTSHIHVTLPNAGQYPDAYYKDGYIYLPGGINTGCKTWDEYWVFTHPGSKQGDQPWYHPTPLPLETDGRSIRYMIFLALTFAVVRKVQTDKKKRNESA